MHHVAVIDVGVGENDLIDFEPRDELREVLLGEDRDTLGVERARQGGGEPAGLDPGDLRRGERPHDDGGVVAEPDEEVEEVPPRGSHDQHVPRLAHGSRELAGP